MFKNEDDGVIHEIAKVTAEKKQKTKITRDQKGFREHQNANNLLEGLNSPGGQIEHSCVTDYLPCKGNNILIHTVSLSFLLFEFELLWPCV